MASRPVYYIERRWAVAEEVLTYMLGPQSTAEYQAAKRNNWNAPPPSMRGMDAESLWRLYGVVYDFRTLNDVRRSWPIRDKKGKIIGTKEEVTDQQLHALYAYADNWMKVILSRIEKEGKRTAKSSLLMLSRKPKTNRPASLSLRRGTIFVFSVWADFTLRRGASCRSPRR